MLELAFELPADSLGAIYILKAHARHVHLEFSASSGPKSPVAANFEIGYGLLGDNGLGKGEFFFWLSK